jgi:hypothetical protein
MSPLFLDVSKLEKPQFGLNSLILPLAGFQTREIKDQMTAVKNDMEQQDLYVGEVRSRDFIFCIIFLYFVPRVLNIVTVVARLFKFFK